MLRSKAIELYNDGKHKCYAFNSLVEGEAIQANQFVIIDNEEAMVIDPGGDLTYAKLNLELRKLTDISKLRYIFASHQDPDIIASIGRWMMQTPATVICAKLWERFLPHFAASYFSQMDELELSKRIVGLEDKGGIVSLGLNDLFVLPAHFLHSVGNFHVYDPISKILFSGDMGASLLETDDYLTAVDFAEHQKSMRGFHERYMVSKKACRLWANMASTLEVDTIVPQHGVPVIGRKNISEFLEWIGNLDCGVDLFSQRDFMVPDK